MIMHVIFALLIALTSAALPAFAQSDRQAGIQSDSRADNPADSVAVASRARAVNINKADAATLSSSLTGVGASRAEAIVRYREEFGPFVTVEDLLEVKGIGTSTLERNRGRITLE